MNKSIGCKNLMSFFFFALLLAPTARAESDSCKKLESEVNQLLVQKSKAISYECVQLGGEPSEKTARRQIVLTSLNNPDEGAETYLAVISVIRNKDKLKVEQVLSSQLVGIEAFPLKFKGKEKLLTILSNSDADHVRFATNVLSDRFATDAVIWELEQESPTPKELSRTTLDTRKPLPELTYVKDVAKFKQ